MLTPLIVSPNKNCFPPTTPPMQNKLQPTVQTDFFGGGGGGRGGGEASSMEKRVALSTALPDLQDREGQVRERREEGGERREEGGA